MSKEASRIRRVISRLKSREDLAELVATAEAEIVRRLSIRDLRGMVDAVVIYTVASEALGNASDQRDLPRYAGAA